MPIASSTNVSDLEWHLSMGTQCAKSKLHGFEKENRSVDAGHSALKRFAKFG